MITKHTNSFTVYPDMCNYLRTNEDKPMIHGGYLAMQMDRCAADLTRLFLFSSVYVPSGQRQLKYRADYAVTVGVNDLVFFDGASLGDLLLLEAEITNLGVKRISISVEVKRIRTAEAHKMAAGIFHFCSMSSDKKGSHPHGLTINDRNWRS
jgi:acyl-CoA hydrolase